MTTSLHSLAFFPMKLFSFKFLLIAAISSPFVTYGMAWGNLAIPLHNGRSAAGPVLGEVIEGPFGFELNNLSKPSDIYEYCEKNDNSFYICTNAPKPHPDLRTYGLEYSEKMGICTISGVTGFISDTGKGIKTKSMADKLTNQISLKYSSKVVKADKIKPDSKSAGPENWLKSIKEEDRVYERSWTFSPKYGISNIYLGTRAEDATTGLIIVTLNTPRVEKCRRFIEVDKTGYDAF